MKTYRNQLQNLKNQFVLSLTLFILINGVQATNNNTDSTVVPTSKPDYIVFPVELLAFEAFVYNDHVNIKWSTFSEINNHHFTLERSTDGINYETVAVLNGSVNSSEVKEYSALDTLPGYGIYFYQLKQTSGTGSPVPLHVIPVRFMTSEIN